MLYPTELQAHDRRAARLSSLLLIGAGDGNRTHAASLEGWNSTIELHPRFTVPNDYSKTQGALSNHFCVYFLFFRKFSAAHGGAAGEALRMIFAAVRLAGNAERAGRDLRRRCAGYEKFSGARKR